MAQLCLVLHALRDDTGYLLWALDHLPNLDAPRLVELAYEAKRDASPAEMARIDGLMRAVEGFRAGVPPPRRFRNKVIVFLIDRTWLPILSVAIKSIKSIFE